MNTVTDAMKTRFQKNHIVLRFVILCLSVIGMGLAIAGLKIVGMGTDPMSTFTFGLERVTGISMGTCQAVCNLLLFIPVIRYDIKKIGIGTLMNMLLIGYIAGYALQIFTPLIPQAGLSTAVRILIFVVSVVGFMLACAFYTAADLGLCSYDAVPILISKHFKKLHFRWIRIIWDVSFLTGGFLLGSQVGITTVIVSFGLGPVIAWIVNRMKPILDQ